jgi:hypothetical protein
MLEMIYRKGYDYKKIRKTDNIIAMFPFSS